MTKQEIIDFFKNEGGRDFIREIRTPLTDDIDDVVFQFTSGVPNLSVLSIIVEEANNNDNFYCPYRKPGTTEKWDIKSYLQAAIDRHKRYLEKVNATTAG